MLTTQTMQTKTIDKGPLPHNNPISSPRPFSSHELKISVCYGLVFYVPFNFTKVISRQCNDDNERLCAIKNHTVMSWILPLAGFELSNLWCEVSSANHPSTTGTLFRSWQHDMAPRPFMGTGKNKWCTQTAVPWINFSFERNFCPNTFSIDSLSEIPMLYHSKKLCTESLVLAGLKEYSGLWI